MPEDSEGWHEARLPRRSSPEIREFLHSEAVAGRWSSEPIRVNLEEFLARIEEQYVPPVEDLYRFEIMTDAVLAKLRFG